MRSLQTLCALVLFALCLISICAAFTSPRFDIRIIRVRGTQRVKDADVRREASYLVGMNLLRAPVTRLHRRLKEMPQVREVNIVRWPAWPVSSVTALTVEVMERQPAFVVRANEKNLLVDADGRVFDAEAKRTGLPVVWLESVSAEVGSRIPRDKLDAVQMIMREASGARLPQPSMIFLDRDGFASLRLEAGTLVRLGDEEWSRKLQWLPAALAKVRHNGEPVEYIDITSSEAPAWRPVPRRDPPGQKERDVS